MIYITLFVLVYWSRLVCGIQPTTQPTTQPTGQPTSKPYTVHFSADKVVNTYAGYTSETYDSRGDGLNAQYARLDTPRGMYIDSSGDLFIAENNRIRKVISSTNIISTFAGGGNDYDTEGVAATSMGAGFIWGLAGDTNGHIYFSDTDFCTVRKVNIGTMTVTTVAGSYATCTYSGDGAAATNARLFSPRGICINSNNLFIADYSNHRVRVVDLISGIISLFAGSGLTGAITNSVLATASTVPSPQSVWVYSDVVYIGDTTNCVIRAVIDGYIYNSAGNGTCGSTVTGVTLARINGPEALCGDTSGNFYAFMSDSSGLYKISSSIATAWVGKISNFLMADGISKTSVKIQHSNGCVIDSSGDIYISDYDIKMVWKITSLGTAKIYIGYGNNIIAPKYYVSFGRSYGLWENTLGDVYIAESGRHRVSIVSSVDDTVFVMAGTGYSGWQEDGVDATTTSLYNPLSVTGDTSGNLYITDNGNHRVRKVIKSTGIISTITGTGSSGCTSATFSGAASSVCLFYPLALAIDRYANLYITDQQYVLRKQSLTTNIISRIAGTGSYGTPVASNLPATSSPFSLVYSIWIDSNDNDAIYLADRAFFSIRRVYYDSSATIWKSEVFTGTGVNGYNGEHIPAKQAMLDSPMGVFGDSSSNIYIVLLNTGRLRMVDSVTNRIHTIAGTGTAARGGEYAAATSTPLMTMSAPHVSHINGDILFMEYVKTDHSRLRRVTYGAPSSQPSTQPSRQPTRQPTSRPSRQPSGQPSSQPSRQPTGHLSSQPRSKPSNQPTAQPSAQPVLHPTVRPSSQPSHQPSSHPSSQPSSKPSGQPISKPTSQPTRQPSGQPTSLPSGSPTYRPSAQPTSQPTSKPSNQPTTQPSAQPVSHPTGQPSSHPSSTPSAQPMSRPSAQPTTQPSSYPSDKPTSQPSGKPSSQPISRPSGQPSSKPSIQPTGQHISSPSGQPTDQPTAQPSSQPTSQPSEQPSSLPSSTPTTIPTMQPSSQPSQQPTTQPSKRPSVEPSSIPTGQPSCQPSNCPTMQPTSRPSSCPSCQPSTQPSAEPSMQPSALPSSGPTTAPSSTPSSLPTSQHGRPTCFPTSQPSSQPSSIPSGLPTGQPSAQPSSNPSTWPSSCPTNYPSTQPSKQPSCQPTSYPSLQPITSPSAQPSAQPTDQPSFCLTSQPSSRPSIYPSSQPSSIPSLSHSSQPTSQPSGEPSSKPSFGPTCHPSSQPSCKPSTQPTSHPSFQPTSLLSMQPTSQPSCQPSCHPTTQPSCTPTVQPYSMPSDKPSSQPSSRPSDSPSTQPTSMPSDKPSSQPSSRPSDSPSTQPTSFPSTQPTAIPLFSPTAQPSSAPTYLSSTLYISSARFSDDGSQVQILFSDATNMVPTSSASAVSYFACSAVLVFAGTESASCSWSNASLLQIHDVDVMSYIKLDIIIGLNLSSGLLRVASHSSCTLSSTKIAACAVLSTKLYEGHVLLRPATRPTLPRLDIARFTLSHVPYCSSWSLYMNALSGSLGRPWATCVITAQGLHFGNASADSRITEAIGQQYNASYSVITISNELLVKGESYKVKLILCNYIGGCSDFEVLSAVSNDSFLLSHPVVRIISTFSRVSSSNGLLPDLLMIFNNSSVKYIYANDSLSISSEAYTPLCGSDRDTSSLRYAWTMESLFSNGSSVQLNLSSISKDVTKFVLRPYALQVNHAYRLLLSVSDTKTGLPSIAFIYVYVLPINEVLAMIQPDFTPQTLLVNKQPIVLDATYSYDPNYGPSSQYTTVHYNWSCQTIDYSSTLPSCLLSITNLTQDGSKVSVSAVSPSVANTTSIMTLQVRSQPWPSMSSYVELLVTSYVGSATVQIYVPYKLEPVIAIQTSRSAVSYVNVDRAITVLATIYSPYPCNGTWSTEGLTLNLAVIENSRYFTTVKRVNAITSADLHLPAYALQGGRAYSFVLQCASKLIDPSSSSVSITVKTNLPPVGGKLAIQPKTGIALNTSFLFQTSLWKDSDLPISSSFFFLSGNAGNGGMGDTSDSESIYLSLSSWSEVFYTTGYLPGISMSEAGDVEVSVLAQDAYEAISARISLLVTVYPFAGNSFTDLLSATSALIQSKMVNHTVGNKDGLQNIASVASSSINLVDCSLAPNCSNINRKACSGMANTCGSCMSAYIAQIPPDSYGNTMCYDVTNVLVVNRLNGNVSSSCALDDSDCPSWQYCNVDRGICVDKNKTCSNPHCSGHGKCYYASLDNLSELYSPIGQSFACSLFNASCSAVCVCNQSYTGEDCGMTKESSALEQVVRTQIFDGLFSVWNSIDLVRSALKDASVSFGSSIVSGQGLMLEASEKIASLASFLLSESLDLLKSSASDTSASSPIQGSDLLQLLSPLDIALSATSSQQTSNLTTSGTADLSSINMVVGNLAAALSSFQSLLLSNVEEMDNVHSSFRLTSRYISNADALFSSNNTFQLQSPLSSAEETLATLGTAKSMPVVTALPNPNSSAVYASMLVYSSSVWQNVTEANVDSDIVSLYLNELEYVDIVLYPSNTVLLQAVLKILDRIQSNNFSDIADNTNSLVDNQPVGDHLDNTNNTNNVADSQINSTNDDQPSSHQLLVRYSIPCNASEKGVVKNFTCHDSGQVITKPCNGTVGEYTGICPYLGFSCQYLDLQSQSKVVQQQDEYGNPEESKQCKVISADSTSVTCRCYSNNASSSTSVNSDRKRRLESGSSAPNKHVDNAAIVGLVVEYVGSDLSTTFSSAGKLNDPSSVGKVYIIIVLYGSLWTAALFFMAYISYKKYGSAEELEYKAKRRQVNKKIDEEALEHNRQLMRMIDDKGENDSDEKRRQRKQSMLSREAKDARKKLIYYVASVFPAIFETPSLVLGIKHEFSRHHLYFNFVFNLLHHRTPVLTIIKMMTIQSFTLFLLALLYDLNYPDDDGSCKQHSSDKEQCLARKYILDHSKSYCEWSGSGFGSSSSSQQDVIHCRYVNPSFSFLVAMYVAIFIAIASCFLVEPLDYIMVLLGSPIKKRTVSMAERKSQMSMKYKR